MTRFLVRADGPEDRTLGRMAVVTVDGPGELLDARKALVDLRRPGSGWLSSLRELVLDARAAEAAFGSPDDEEELELREAWPEVLEELDDSGVAVLPDGFPDLPEEESSPDFVHLHVGDDGIYFRALYWEGDLPVRTWTIPWQMIG